MEQEIPPPPPITRKPQSQWTSSNVVEEERIRTLNDRDVSLNGTHYVLYWMQASVRTEFNPALEYAIERSNALN
jgi:hypothetical protein